MGLLDIFGKGPLSDKRIDKIAKLAANPFAQPDVRMKEMQRLLGEQTPAALRGVLKRFAANASGAIADEDEKQWLEDALVDVGEAAIEPLRAYIGAETQLTYALRAYRRIAGDAEAVRFFISVLQHYGPDDYRSGDAKVQLMLQLAEDLADPRVLPALVDFLVDHNDEVRWAAMDLLDRAADRGQLDAATRDKACVKLATLVLDDDVGPRIQVRACEIFASREWQVAGAQEELAAFLGDAYFLDKKRYVRRRAKVAKKD
ncbi:MAG: hypothetical protein HY903_13425 [Deltaproteobacteria bacterium]|nr:hypothetical protein [Deltaproteobacteria bacterium]